MSAGRRQRACASLAVGALVCLVVPARAARPPGVEQALLAASVLVGSGCSGVLVDGPDLVLTAEHCIDGGATHTLRFSDGSRRTGWVAGVDREADQALLLLEEPVALQPLRLAPRPPIAGTVLYFAGNPSRARFREATLDRTGRCPSLPSLGNALFTTIDGVPGDSGAAIVDGAARVVGLVHGGAQCRIATPSDTLRRLIADVLK
ncbi:MAG: trypsin-like peptidase domain-containing protein [Deltaproteobacteria bacterium]|nr:trypsin-like peptidase domain-containing protein [Deltaproteobacteria bacterium]